MTTADRSIPESGIQILRTALASAIDYLDAAHNSNGLHDRMGERGGCEGCEVLADLKRAWALAARPGSVPREVTR